MDYLYLSLGLLTATLYCLFSRGRNRVQYFGTGLLVASAIYLLFTLLAGEFDFLKIEATGLFFYLLFWRLAMRHGLLWLGVGWLLHPLWDYFVHLDGPGVDFAPRWYAVLCLSFDVVVAGYCFWLASRPRRPARSVPSAGS